MTATVDDTATSTTGTASTSHTVNYTTSPTSGETLLMLMSTSYAGDPNPTATGWTQFFSDNNASAPSLAGLWRESDGTEGGGTVTVTTNTSTQSATRMFELSAAADPDTSPPEAATATTGNSATPNPPSLSPSGGSDDYLWIPCCGYLDDNELNSGPSGYSNFQAVYQTTWVYTSVGTDYRANTAASEDPGTFGASGGSRTWVAQTVAVYPGAAAGLGMPIAMHHYKQMWNA